MRVSLVCVRWGGLVLYADDVCVGKEVWFWSGIVLGLEGMGCGML